MGANPPSGGGGSNTGFSATQAPTIVIGGPPIERKELFRGRSSHSTELKLHVLGSLLCIAGFVLAVFLFFASFGLLSIIGLVLILIGSLLVGLAFLRIASVSYRVDTLRVEVERGILQKRIDNLELWRVKDIQFRQTLVQRMLSVGDVVLVTSDASNPQIELRGIPKPRDLYDSLRDAVDTVRRGRGVMGVEQSS